jgi:hypothetical protein
MRRVAGCMGLLWLVAGCTVPAIGELPGTCLSDADCGTGALCDEGAGICYAAGTEPEFDGGTCPFTCAEYQACTSAGCRPRFTALNILSPADNAVLSNRTVQVSAQLVANPTYAFTTQFPPSLSFLATWNGGGDAGSFGAVTHDGGVYTVPWTPPQAQAQIALTAAHPVPAAGLSSTIEVTVDSTAPTFTIHVPVLSSRPDGTPGTQASQRDPTVGFDVAFRRDETITVTVSANEVAFNVELTVVGIGAGGAEGQSKTLTMHPGGTCEGSPPFCQIATLDLSQPEMSAFRGSMFLHVRGQDGAGNVSTASQELKVTRWKWAFDAAGNILGTPAIGNKGTVYFGTSVAGNGKAFAVDLNGTKRWDFSTGDVLGSPAVGDFVSDNENVYVAAKTGNTPTFYAIASTDTGGAEKRKCTYNGTNDLPNAIAVGTTMGLQDRETAVTLYNGATPRVAKIRPETTVGLEDECPDITGVPASVPGGSVVLRGTNVFYGTADFKITSYDIASTSNAPRANWPQDTTDFTRGLSILDETVYGGASDTDSPVEGGLFSVPTTIPTSGTITRVYPEGAVTSRVFNMAIGLNNTAYFGAETATTKELLALPLGTPSPQITRASNVGTLRGAPVVGKNDRLYTLNDAGRVTAWTASTLAQQWSVDVTPVVTASTVSPTLDCRRNATGQPAAGPGTLYIAAATKLYAFIVDSPGLETGAPWPKFQRDARNTGNPGGSGTPPLPITNCP